jgi:hypothetical protein
MSDPRDMTRPELRSLSVVFSAGGLRFQVRYVRRGGPNPGTKARAREVRELVHVGLSDALQKLDGGAVAVTQEAGFETRMDTIEVGEA